MPAKSDDSLPVSAQYGDDGMLSIGVTIDDVFVPLASLEGAYVKSRVAAGKSPEATGASPDGEGAGA